MKTIYPGRFNSRTHDYQEIGGTPNDEPCTQAGGNIDDQKAECKALINQLIRMHGPPPADCEFCIIRNQHDFGEYCEAGILYPEDNGGFDTTAEELEDGLITQEEADARENARDTLWDYINKCEHLPDTWDEAAKQELHEAGHPRFTAKILNLKIA